MGVLEDVRKWLKEIPIWQELEKVPDRMGQLETRMADLEERLRARPGETCPKCGEHALRLVESGRVKGEQGKQFRIDRWGCSSGCGHSEDRVIQFR